MSKAWDELINQMDERYKAGEKIYIQLQNNRPDNLDILIAPAHLGDTLWVAVYAEAYCKQNNCGVIIVCIENHRSIAERAEGVDQIITLDEEQMIQLSFYIIASARQNTDHIRYCHMNEVLLVCNDSCTIMHTFGDRINDISMGDMAREYLGLDSEVNPSRIRIEKEPEPERENKYKNTILIAPIARTYTNISKSFWEKLANRLVSAGFRVCTNYNGFPDEYIIEGTEPLALTIDEVFRCSDSFAGIITYRSGLSDLVSQTDARLTVIYPEKNAFSGIELEDNDIRHDDVREFGRRENIWNFQWKEEDHLIDRIVENHRSISDVNDDRKIIVTLTSRPGRIDTVAEVISSLKAQTLIPDRIELWLTEEEFPEKSQMLPEELISMQDDIFCICWERENLRSYTKLLPALNAHPEDILITVDDDMIYDSRMVEKLVMSWKEHSLDIHAHRITKFFLCDDEWRWTIGGFDYYDTASALNMLNGCSGVLYPPHSFRDTVLDRERIRKLAPTNDDIWFWAMGVLNGRKVRTVKDHIVDFNVISESQDEMTLSFVNEGNDHEFQKQLLNVFDAFPEFPEILKTEFERYFPKEEKACLESDKKQVLDILGNVFRLSEVAITKKSEMLWDEIEESCDAVIEFFSQVSKDDLIDHAIITDSIKQYKQELKKALKSVNSFDHMNYLSQIRNKIEYAILSEWTQNRRLTAFTDDDDLFREECGKNFKKYTKVALGNELKTHRQHYEKMYILGASVEAKAFYSACC